MSAGDHPPAPFIVGAGRSGTTLLRLMLDSHPQLAIPPETHFIPRLHEAFPDGVVDGPAFAGAVAAERRFGDFGFDEGDLAARVGAQEVPLPDALRAFYAAYAERHGKRRWGDKTPGYVSSLGLVRGLLGEARFIHVIRDGRDVALAASARNGKRPARCAVVWRKAVLAARDQAAGLDGYLEVRYEDLVRDTEPTLRRVCELIELDWDPAMLDYHRRADERLRELGDLPGRKIGGREATAELRRSFYELNSSPPLDSEIGRWRTGLDPDDVGAIEAKAGDLLAELGYEDTA
jgi:hypothetical protein